MVEFTETMPALYDRRIAEMSWVPIGSSADVSGRRIAAIDVAERELVAWRTSRGRLCVMDARCPHQWSHLAFEGVVDGDEILCGAHFWQFDCEGRGTKVNLAGRRDPKADIAVFASRERDGVIEVDLPD
jgi:phenylpropionate dioxygenase-like ring-hydroxylating dioxygenase large terminal subunit